MTTLFLNKRVIELLEAQGKERANKGSKWFMLSKSIRGAFDKATEICSDLEIDLPPIKLGSTAIELAPALSEILVNVINTCQKEKISVLNYEWFTYAPYVVEKDGKNVGKIAKGQAVKGELEELYAAMNNGDKETLYKVVRSILNLPEGVAIPRNCLLTIMPTKEALVDAIDADNLSSINQVLMFGIGSDAAVNTDALMDRSVRDFTQYLD